MTKNVPTLRRRMMLTLGLMVLGSLTIGIGAIVSVNSLREDLGIATQGYRQLHQLFSVGYLASKARDATAATPPQPAEATAALQTALTILNQKTETDSIEGAPAKWINESDRADCVRLVSDAMSRQSATSLDLLFAKLSKVSDGVRNSIFEAQSAADRKRSVTLDSVLTLCIVVVIAAVILGITQYRRVIEPIRRIGRGVRAFAKGDFDQRIEIAGDREFAALSSDFNRMADELSALYRDLEEKVQSKSKELVRSERLASVGYLAAGVAHEINNPLGIIAGYGERAMQQLSAGLNDQSLPKTHKALSVICEEAFRCKEITDRLLSLARPGPDSRSLISIAAIANQVIYNLSGLGSVRQRSLSVQTDTLADLKVLASEGELKQVILNLLINALEAVDPITGQVRVRVNRLEDQIELSVIDNGQGMSAETVERVFEPFFSQKRGERSGTGLGLSIANAIITDHGGQLRADSDGPGRGSTFTILLPAAVKGALVANDA